MHKLASLWAVAALATVLVGSSCVSARNDLPDPGQGDGGAGHVGDGSPTRSTPVDPTDGATTTTSDGPLDVATVVVDGPVGPDGSMPCTAGATRCAAAGAAVEVCSAGSWIAQQTCPSICAAGACAGDCKPGSKRCTGLTPQTCDDSGTWKDGTACPNLCTDGDCAGACTPGQRRCQDGAPQTCTPAGVWMAGTACPYVCTGDGNCTGECKPQSTTCQGAIPRTCGDDGMWKDGQACASVCTNGSCTGVCLPGQRRCSGSTQSQICNGAGQWTNDTNCSYLCTDGNCAGECKPGSVTCAGTTLKTCGNDATYSSMNCTSAPAGGTNVCRSNKCDYDCSGGANKCEGGCYQCCQPSHCGSGAGWACGGHQCSCPGIMCGASCNKKVAGCFALIRSQTGDSCPGVPGPPGCGSTNSITYPCTIGVVVRQLIADGSSCDATLLKNLGTQGCHDYIDKRRQPNLDSTMPIYVTFASEVYDSAGNAIANQGMVIQNTDCRTIGVNY